MFSACHRLDVSAGEAAGPADLTHSPSTRRDGGKLAPIQTATAVGQSFAGHRLPDTVRRKRETEGINFCGHVVAITRTARS